MIVTAHSVCTPTSSNSGISDHIIQTCLPNPDFPCKAALSLHPEMKGQAMTRSTFNNSGFQAPALMDLTFEQHQLESVHAYTVVQCAEKFASSQINLHNLHLSYK